MLLVLEIEADAGLLVWAVKMPALFGTDISVSTLGVISVPAASTSDRDSWFWGATSTMPGFAPWAVGTRAWSVERRCLVFR